MIEDVDNVFLNLANDLLYVLEPDDLEGSQFFGGMQTLPSTSRDFRTQSNRRRTLQSAGNVESSEKRNETDESALEEDMEDGHEQVIKIFKLRGYSLRHTYNNNL